jgi:hypothetical protein
MPRKKGKVWLCSMLTFCSLVLPPINSFAGAWVEDKGRSTLTTDVLYAPKSTWFSGDFAQDSLDNTINNRIANKTSYTGASFDLEHGIDSDVTLIANAALYYYDDVIVVASSLNNASNQYFSLSSNYYNLDTQFGFKEKLFRDDYSALSTQFLIYPGNLVIKDSIDYLQKRFAIKGSLLYGHSFNIPFGMEGRPDYGSYIDMELAYKNYPISGKNEVELDVSLGLRPFNNNTLIVVGLYNTFNGYSYTKRPFDIAAINSGIAGLGLTPELADSLKSDIVKDLTTDGSNPYHQLNFQLGFQLTGDSVLYLQSFHNVIKSKPFTYNSYYISLENKF